MCVCVSVGGGVVAAVSFQAILHNGSARISSRSLPRPPFMSITELSRLNTHEHTSEKCSAAAAVYCCAFMSMYVEIKKPDNKYEIAFDACGLQSNWHCLQDQNFTVELSPSYR